MKDQNQYDTYAPYMIQSSSEPREEKKKNNNLEDGMILYFETNNGKRKEIGHPESEKEIFQLISDFLKKHNYKSYYTRIWKNEKGEICYDVGSHSEFFVLIDGEQYNEIREALK